MTDQTTRETLERLASLAEIEGQLLANRERLRQLAEAFQARRTALRAAGLTIDRERQRLVAQGARASGPDEATMTRQRDVVETQEQERSRLMTEFESQLATDDHRRTEIRAEAAALEARRETLAQTLPRSLATVHRLLRERQIVNTVARLEQGACAACGAAQDLDEEELPPVTCEACDRILIDESAARPAQPASRTA